MENKPSPETTLAIILGASQWPSWTALEQPQSANFVNSAKDFKKYLTSKTGFNLPKENLLWLFDTKAEPNTIDNKISVFLKKHIEDSTTKKSISDLLFYYVGHGVLEGTDRRQLFLALRTSRVEGPEISSYSMNLLAKTIKKRANLLRCFLIIDCCYSDRTGTSFQAGQLSTLIAAQTDQAFERPPDRGYAFLCASNANDPAVNPPEKCYTMFSGALLETLQKGSQDKPDYLSLYDVHELSKTFIEQTYESGKGVIPVISTSSAQHGDIRTVKLFRNSGFKSSKSKANKTKGSKTENSEVRSESDEKHDTANTIITNLIGRNDNIKTIISRLDKEHIIAIVGTPGGGKTALAKSVRDNLNNPEYGFTSAKLIDLRGELLNSAQTRIFLCDHISKELEAGASEHEITKKVDSGSGRTLIILDNVEQFLNEGLDSEFESFIHQLTDKTLKLRVLLTSRTRPRGGEIGIFPIKGLRVPPENSQTLGTLQEARSEFSAIDFFCNYAKSQGIDVASELTDEQTEDIASIVRHLKGIPLFIQQAAEQLHERTPNRIRTDLEQLNPMGVQRPTDILTISWGLLEETTKRACRMLAVFAGVFSRQAALYILAGSSEDKQEAIEALDELQRKSLLDREEKRDETGEAFYSFHPLIRQFVLLQLKRRKWSFFGSRPSNEEKEANSRFTQYFGQLWDWNKLASHVTDTKSLDFVAADELNFRQFFNIAIQSRQLDNAVKAIEPLLWHFYRSARFEQGANVLKAASDQLGNPKNQKEQLALGYILCARSWLLHWLDRLDEAQRDATNGVTLLERSEPIPRGRIIGLETLAANQYRWGNYIDANTIMDEAIELAQTASKTDPTIMVRVLYNSIWSLVLNSQFDEAQTRLDRAKEIVRSNGIPNLHIDTLILKSVEGFLNLCRLDLVNAKIPLEEGEKIAVEIRHWAQLPIILNYLAIVNILPGLGGNKINIEGAREACKEIEKTSRRNGERLALALGRTSLAFTELLEGNMTNAQKSLSKALTELDETKNRACASLTLLCYGSLKLEEALKSPNEQTHQPLKAGLIAFGCLQQSKYTISLTKKLLEQSLNAYSQKIVSKGVCQEDIDSMLQQGHSRDFDELTKSARLQLNTPA
jgi:molybdopterin-guanine dinucleotide biosynthesis protein